MPEIEVRRASPAEVLALAVPLLPGTVQLVADLEGGGPGSRVRPVVAVSADRPVGAVVLTEICRWRWYATAIVLDPSAVVPLARVVDASPAWDLTGPSAHIDPLLPHIGRVQKAGSTPFFATDVPYEGTLDPRCRLARPSDLEALVELYSGFELDRIPTRGRLRHFLRRALDARPVLVAEQEGTIVGASRCEWRTRDFDCWSGMTVPPEHRGQGLMMVLGTGAGAVTGASGRRICATLGPTNPFKVERASGDTRRVVDAAAQDQWTFASLQSPRSFPGHRRLRAAVEQASGALDRRRAPGSAVDASAG